jgi:hypothetical protein
MKEMTHQFDNVLNLRKQIENIFGVIDSRLVVINDLYKSMIKEYGHNNDFTLAMDSFHFQGSLIEAELKHMKDTYYKIGNRLYGEYYKLYHMVIKYIRDDIKNSRLVTNYSKTFPSYKTINNRTIYSINNTKTLHSLISEVIVELETIIISKETELVNDRRQTDMGLNVDSLIHMHSYANQLMRAKIDMFREHLEAFINHHTKYYTRLLTRAQLHIGILNDDINIQQFKEGSTDIVSLRKDNSYTVSKNNSTLGNTSIINEVKKDNDINKNVTAGKVNKISKDEDSIDRTVDIKEDVTTTNKKENVVNEPTNNIDIGDSTDIKSECGETDISRTDVPDDERFNDNKIGARVGVVGYDEIGTLVFYGERIGGGGKRCGIVFDAPIGKNNGTIKGHEYFSCEDKHGILTIPSKIVFTDETEAKNEVIVDNTEKNK